jgi:tetratricopeptide (TPR) repeat protein
MRKPCAKLLQRLARGLLVGLTFLVDVSCSKSESDDSTPAPDQESNADSYAAERLRAGRLMALRRTDEAMPILVRLIAQKRDAAVEALLVSAYVETGEATKAWQLAVQLASELGAGGTGTEAERKIANRIRVGGATALNALGRHAEAREFVLPMLLESPEDPAGIHQLIVALRPLGLAKTSEALAQRRRELHACLHERERERSSRQGGRVDRSYYHCARAWLEIDRVADALEAIESGLESFPDAADLYLLQADAHLRLGNVTSVADSLERVTRRTGSHVLGLCLARLRAREGGIDVAKGIFRAVAKSPPTDPRENAMVRSHILWAELDLGGTEYVRRSLRRSPVESSRDSVPEIAMLCRAESMLAAGDFEKADAIVSQSFRSIPGGKSWANALRAVLDAVRRTRSDAGGAVGDPARRDVDPSDLVDNPALARRLGAIPRIASSAAAMRLIDSSADLRERRRRILERVKSLESTHGSEGSSALALRRELIEIYLASGAARKAREAAWFVWHRNRTGVDENLLLARALSRREEILPRLAALERALERAPSNGSIVELHAAALHELGIER